MTQVQPRANAARGQMSAARNDSAMVEPMAMQEPESELPLADSLGPELMKMLEDFGGVEGDLAGKGAAAVGSTLDSAMYNDLDMYVEDASGMAMSLEPSSFSAPELGMPAALGQQPHAPTTPHLDRCNSGACGEISPPASAFMQASGRASSPRSPTRVHTPQKPRSIRRARSSLPGAMQQRG